VNRKAIGLYQFLKLIVRIMIFDMVTLKRPFDRLRANGGVRVFCGHFGHISFDKALLSKIEGLITNGL
jgi:hypothetical protein